MRCQPTKQGILFVSKIGGHGVARVVCFRVDCIESRDIFYVFLIHSLYSFVCVIILKKSCGLFVYTYFHVLFVFPLCFLAVSLTLPQKS